MATKAKLPSTAVGRRRLLKLADLLEADAANKKGIQFDLSWWGRARDPSNPVSCGTSGCAMGLAVVSGAFTRAGLRPMKKSGDLVPTIGRARGIDAAMRLFGIERTESEWLFLPEGRYGDMPGAKSERQVAKRIRDFVAGKAAPKSSIKTAE